MALNHQRQGEHDYCNGLQNQSSNQDSMTRKDLWHWLGDRRIPKSEIDGKSTKFLLDRSFSMMSYFIDEETKSKKK